MKNWFISITIIVLLATPVSALAAPQEPGSAPAIQGIVHIVHAQPLQKGSARVIHETGSLGTVIGPRLILTHNHFGAALGTLPNETFTISDGTGRSAVVRVADVKRIAIDRGTLLLQLPDSVNLTVLPLAERATISRLAAGDWLTVNYWDNADQRLAAKDFRLIKTANGVATLADPDRVINPGDSGGGVFFNGQLIGNTWSYNADVNGNSLGSFNVALVPVQVAAVQ
jgi:hypothetical protein